MSINSKIIQYLKYKWISQREFARQMGFADGILRGSDSLKAKFLKPLRENYSDLSINWLLFDEGDMIIDDPPVSTLAEPSDLYKTNNNCYKEVRELQGKLIETQEKLIAEKELNSVLQKQIQPLKKHSAAKS